MSTFSELVQKTIVELRMEGGVSVQQYAEDIIAAKLQRMFNTLFDQYYWPAYTVHGESFTLDGSTGVVTGDLTSKIKRQDDIGAIWYGSEIKPLPRKPMWINVATLTGGLRRYWEPTSTTKIFRIIPIASTGTVRVTYRTKPDNFIASDEVKLDDDLLVGATVLDWLTDMADSELSVKKWEQTVNKRETQLRAAMNAGGVPFGSAAPSAYNEWMSN